MAEMFAAVSDLYSKYWHEYFHFALFEEGVESWTTAFENTHRRYMAALKADEAESILVMACGRGGFAHFLATHSDARVLGIDISAAQLSHTAPLKRPNLRFMQHDVMQVDALEERFDAVVCLDAACYFPDKALAVKKTASVIRPGGRLLIVDWCRQENVTRLQNELVLEPFMRYWAVPNLATPAEYRAFLSRSGLEIAAVDDLNDLTRPNWDYAYERALEGVRSLSEETLASLIWKGMKLGPRGVRLMKEQFPAALHIKAAFDLGILRYVAFLAQMR